MCVEGMVAVRVGYAAFAFQSAVLALASGLIIAGSGLAAWHLAPASRVGSLLAAAGAASFLGAFGQLGWEAAAALAVRLTWLYVAMLGHVVLTQPDGRVARPAIGVVVAAVYLCSLVSRPDDPLPLAVGLASPCR